MKNLTTHSFILTLILNINQVNRFFGKNNFSFHIGEFYSKFQCLILQRCSVFIMMTEENYKSSLNLPQTDFPMKANLAIREKELIEKWEKMDLYHQMIHQNLGKPLYFLHDGPPYANGNLHVGHALNKTLKDILMKYYNMKGYYSPFILGWDCHGLPIELQVTQKLKGKQVPANTVRRLSREHAQSFVDLQRDSFKRLLILADQKNPYITMSYAYEATILDVFIQAFQKNFIYRGLRPVHWCISCQTALAEAEIEYYPHFSLSIYVAFPIDENLSVLIWTTTPWTLPSNLGVAFHQDFLYSIVQDQETGKQYIIAKELKESVEKQIHKTLIIVKDLTIQEITNLKVQHPFLERSSLVVFGDHVTLESGTGIVHTAPGHGQEDFVIGQKYGLGMIMPIDAAGHYTAEVPLFEGLSINEGNPKIVELLKEKGLLLGVEEIEHSYPHCWRCKNPLIIRTTGQFFINIHQNDLKKKLIHLVENNVQYIPAERKKRMLGVMENRPDWCISRQRVWGVPIPSLECLDCQQVFLNDQVLKDVQLRGSKEGFDFWFDENQTVSELFPYIKECECCHGSVVRLQKGQDILDVWFDSGVSFYFLKNRLKAENILFDQADLNIEGSDQFRGWFQTSLILYYMIENKSPYKQLLSHGYVLDAQGLAMSKSIGNILSPLEIVQNYGADILRLWAVSQDYTQDMKGGDSLFKQSAEMYRKIRNNFRFMLSNLYDYTQEVHNSLSQKDLKPIDQWAFFRFLQIEKEAHELYEKKDLQALLRMLFEFINIDLSSFYLDVLKDSLYTLGKRSSERKSSQYVFYFLVKKLSQLLAPILSFTCEEVYTYWPQVENQKESIFLTHFEVEEVSLSLKKSLQTNFEIVEKVQLLREDVLKALEIARQNKMISSSLEAQVLIETGHNKKAFDFCIQQQEALATYFIVSKVIVDERNRLSFQEYAVIESKNIDYEGCKIYIHKAPGNKCPRCWKYRENVSNQNVCDVCEKAIKEN